MSGMQLVLLSAIGGNFDARVVHVLTLNSKLSSLIAMLITVIHGASSNSETVFNANCPTYNRQGIHSCERRER